MTDHALAAALTDAERLEKAARARWQSAPTVAEQQAALLVVRHVTATIKALKDWIAARAQALASA